MTVCAWKIYGRGLEKAPPISTHPLGFISVPFRHIAKNEMAIAKLLLDLFVALFVSKSSLFCDSVILENLHQNLKRFYLFFVYLRSFVIRNRKCFIFLL